jgi:hypothetical protein
MLANLGEQQAGLLSLNGRYARPGVEYRSLPRTSANETPAYGVQFQSMPLEEFTAKRKAHFASRKKDVTDG